MKPTWTARMAVLAGLLALSGCGSDATGITLQIQPNPIPARATRALGVQSTAYEASWTVTVTELSGTGGTLEFLGAELRNATLPVNATTGRGGSSLMLANGAVLEGFSRTTFTQTSTLVPTDAAQPVSVVMSARYRDTSGQVFEATTEAAVTLP